VSPINDLHQRCLHWFGKHYDLDATDVVMAASAVEKFNDGSDPLWPLVVGGPGGGKTETVMPLRGCGGLVVSTISSDAALLSGTPQKERKKNATGGLLRQLGDRGVLIVKDMTSILSLHPNMRAQIMAALREIYDGHWYRDIGADGGRRLEWSGRIAIVGAVTTAWDRAHAAVAQMGDRFVLLRMDSTQHRLDSGRKAIANTGGETGMREELATLAAGVIDAVNAGDPPELDETESERILAAADLVSLSRTAVDYDYRGDVIDAHAPEAPTRLGKQLAQVMRGTIAIGLTRESALRLAIRCARDSMPPLRLEIIDDLAANPYSTTTDVRKRVGRPRNTVDRQLQALHMLRVVEVDEEPRAEGGASWWRYTLAEGIDPNCLLVPEITADTVFGKEESLPTVISGTSGDTPNKQDDGLFTTATTTYERDAPTRYRRAASNGQPHADPSANRQPSLCACGNEMVSPQSVARGHCERCHLSHKCGCQS
jgi:hypothetical protein